MPPNLKPLLLPQLVQERMQRESTSDSEMDLSSSTYYNTQSTFTSEIPSPVTPTFSTHGHFRYPSSTSSIESPYNASICDPPSSPIHAPKTSKRSLPDVQEEPQEHKDGFEMFDDSDDLYDCLCKFARVIYHSFGEYS